MHSLFDTVVYFFYGLSFFCMGMVTALEVGRCSDLRLRHALRYLAGFGLLHSAHEWLEMFHNIVGEAGYPHTHVLWEGTRLILLALSFLSLGAFGSLLIAPNEKIRRLSMLGPLFATGLWAYGMLTFKGQYLLSGGLLDVADVWTRYVLAIPSAVWACAGLVHQQREFRRVGMAQFGRDSLWAAIAFAWYGLVGQLFIRPSLLWPSTFLNSDLFYDIFGFPVQLLRAVAALLVAIFVIRFLRSFEVATQRKIDELQAARLEEAQRREALRGELLRRVVAAQEAERQRIARELHDETGQALTAIGLGLRGASSALRQDREKAAHNLRQLEGMVDHSLNELQRVIADLRPSHLDDLGLPAALRWYGNEIQNRTTLLVAVEISGEARDIPPEVKTALFRVAQEALTNVVRHAHARAVQLRLAYHQGRVTLTVEDDGCGFDQERLKMAQRPSWGLLGMEERASLLGGELKVTSLPGRGTRVQVIIPFFQKLEEVRDENTPVVSG